MTDYESVTTMRGSGLVLPWQAPKSWVSAGLLAAVAVAILGGWQHAGPKPAPAAAFVQQPVRIVAVDRVAPQPIDLVFAKPVAPVAKPAVKPVAKPAAKPVVKPVAKPVPAPRSVARTRVVSAAAPATSADCFGSGWEQRRGEKALASLRHGAPAGVTVTFLPGRGGLKGMTYYDRHAVEVYVNSCARESDELLRHVVAHELGHAWDSLHMTGALRADYLAARGIAAGTPWFGCSQCQDFATPAGDFAETYAQWQRGAGDSRSQMARPATQAELADLGARFFS